MTNSQSRDLYPQGEHEIMSQQVLILDDLSPRFREWLLHHNGARIGGPRQDAS